MRFGASTLLAVARCQAASNSHRSDFLPSSFIRPLMSTSSSPAHPLRHVSPLSPVPDDLECARSVSPHNIKDIAQYLGIKDGELELYGDKKAKARDGLYCPWPPRRYFE